jgi:hypothetical protein
MKSHCQVGEQERAQYVRVSSVVACQALLLITRASQHIQVCGVDGCRGKAVQPSLPVHLGLMALPILLLSFVLLPHIHDLV